MWTRAPIQQELGHVVMIVIEGEHQRSHSLGCRLIHIRAGGDQRLETVVAAVTCRVQKGGQSSNRTVLRTRLRSNLAGPVRVERPRLEVGSLGKEQPH